MLRIHFTSDDLARIRMVPAPDPLWEVLLSSYRLRHPSGAVYFGAWRRTVATRLSPSARLLAALAPPTGYAVDFLTPPGAGPAPAAGLDALRRTPRTRLRRDLEELHHRHPARPLPAWTRGLAEGDPGAVSALSDAVAAYFAAALEPFWPRVRRQVQRDHEWRTRALDTTGWEGVLATLHPSATWHYPVLELAFPADHDVHLDGRGLTLQPSFFCWGAPTTFLDTGLPPVLVYPVERSLDWSETPHPPGRQAVAALLGRTRARVLEVVATAACTTTQLSERAHVPIQTASHQAAVLREANLIHSRRHRNTVVHTVTALGAALLHGESGPPPFLTQ
ncbi:ArsR/SmtB family transcription factor [Streptomyces humi]|uniref:ArsR/SmtB family transcription factor n=1 Tax=Streptomyces humi TaxID=1428620 RepID=UPI00062876E1|nr:winged helix-turn-helix domain-containing protein [Streptomyces humi]